MGEGRKNATKTVTCQIDDLRLVAGNVICLVSAGLKIRLADCIRSSTYRGFRGYATFLSCSLMKRDLLFDFDLCTSGLDLLLDLVRLLLGHPFLDCFGCALHERLRLSEP
jgi:hypothetical protein